jgi:outer membrane protein assembly factor BamB
MRPDGDGRHGLAEVGWRRLSAVAAAVSLVALLLLIASALPMSGRDPKDETRAFSSVELRELKSRLAENPADQALKDEIRALDQKLREGFFARRARTRRNALLLLIAVVVVLVAVSQTGITPTAPPTEPPPGEPPDEEGREARRSRNALAGLGALLGLLGLAWGLGSRARLPESIDAAATAAGSSLEELRLNWPRFRGQDGSGVGLSAEAPATWDAATGENVLWKVAVPRPGRNSPLLWGERVFLTGADASGREVFAFDARSGELAWRSTIQVAGGAVELPEVTDDTGLAASTGATDGRRVYVIFATGEVGAFELDGTQVWARTFGPFQNNYGHASSLVAHEGRLFVQLDQGMEDDGLSRLVALDAATGETAWEALRPVDASWTTPLVIPGDDQDEIVLCAAPWVISYDATTGAELWRARHLSGEVVPSPVATDDLVLAMHQEAGVFAIRRGGQGDVTESHLAWKLDLGAPGIPSPLVSNGLLYVQEDDGYLTCYQASDGAKVWEHELIGRFNASPSLSGEHLYTTDTEGVTYTLRAGREAVEVGRSELGEPVFASFAFGSGRIFIRGEQHLFAIGEAGR